MSPRARRLFTFVLATAGCNATPSAEPRTPVATLAIPIEASSAAPSTPAPPSASDDPLADAVRGTKLTPREREEWGAYVTELIAPCPSVAVSIATCIVEKRACATCETAARFLLREVREGRSRERIERDYKRRFDPSSVRAIAIDGSPTLGAKDAPVTVVVFSDFECPACALAAPILDAAVKDGRARLVYKLVALPHHTHAEPAARAALAAGEQGKFWAMHHEIFAHQSALEQRDLEGYAKGLGLDVRRFVVDMRSAATTARIDADAALWKTLALHGTPTVFVDGREIDEIDRLAEWISDR